MSYFILSDKLQRAWQGPFLFFYFYFSVESVNGSRNYLVMDIGVMYDTFQEWRHLTLGEKGQIDLRGECTMFIVLWGLCSLILNGSFSLP